MNESGLSRLKLKWLWWRFRGSSRACRLLLQGALLVALAGGGGLLYAGARQALGDSVLTLPALLLLLLGLFWLLSAYIPQLADGLVYRRRLHPEVILAQVTEKLAGALYVADIAELLAQELPQRLGAAHGVLLVVNEERTALQPVEPAAGAPLESAAWDQFWLTLPNAPLALSAAAPPAVLAWMRAQTIELLTPLLAGKRLIGLLGLGPRPGGCGYFADEIRMVGTLARHATIAVQNALLVQHMAFYQQQLQEEVAQHTRIMMADRSRLNAILQNLADALLVTDAGGRIQLVNPVAENLLRRAARTLLGQDIREVAPVPEWLAVIARAQEHPGIIETTRITMTDPRLLLETGALGERILTVSATALGDRSAVICVLHDITHEVEVDRLKSGFITMVSHELRTPLTSILGFTRLIQRIFTRTILPAVPAEATVQQAVDRITKNLEIMVQEGGRLTALLNDVLDISALDSGGIEWHDQAFSPAEVLTQVVTQYQPHAAQKGCN